MWKSRASRGRSSPTVFLESHVCLVPQLMTATCERKTEAKWLKVWCFALLRLATQLKILKPILSLICTPADLRGVARFVQKTVWCHYYYFTTPERVRASMIQNYNYQRRWLSSIWCSSQVWSCVRSRLCWCYFYQLKTCEREKKAGFPPSHSNKDLLREDAI